MSADDARRVAIEEAVNSAAPLDQENREKVAGLLRGSR